MYTIIEKINADPYCVYRINLTSTMNEDFHHNMHNNNDDDTLMLGGWFSMSCYIQVHKKGSWETAHHENRRQSDDLGFNSPWITVTK